MKNNSIRERRTSPTHTYTLIRSTQYITTMANLAEATSALVLLLAAVAAPSSAADEQYAGRPPVECVAFESDEENPNVLQMGQCLTPGNAICSTGGSWALGIDPADRMIKLWEGNLVSSRLFVLEFIPSSGISPPWSRPRPGICVFMARDTNRYCHHIISCHII